MIHELSIQLIVFGVRKDGAWFAGSIVSGVLL
jgi:hypothetical protein